MSAGFHLPWEKQSTHRWRAVYPNRVFWYFQIEELRPRRFMLHIQPPWTPAARVVQRELLSLHHKHQNAVRLETALGMGEKETELGPFRSKHLAQNVAQSYLDAAIPLTVKMIQEKGTPQDAYFMGQLRRVLEPEGQIAVDRFLEANQNPKKKGIRHYPWMKLQYTEPFIPLMKKRGAAKVARSYRGFYTAFKKAGGKPSQMGLTHKDTPNRDRYPWWQRRNEFIARHMAQVNKNNEDLWDSSGNPTNRHLGLIAWAYTPDPDGVQQWVQQHNARQNGSSAVPKWSPEWHFFESGDFSPERWVVYDLPIGLGVVRRQSIGGPYTGPRNHASAAFEVEGRRRAEAYLKASRQAGLRSAIFVGSGTSYQVFLSVQKTPEKARQLILDLYLMLPDYLPPQEARALLRALPPEALVRRDWLLSQGA